jgi:hypothetical protein
MNQSSGPSLIFPMHAGAHTAFNVVGVLLILLFVTIPVAIWVFIRSARGRIEISGSEVILRSLFTRRWTLANIRRLGVLAVPIYARGIGGALARKKVGGKDAIHLCAIDDRGRKSTLLVSMFERYPEIIDHVAAVTRLPVEEVKVGALGPKWPG